MVKIQYASDLHLEFMENTLYLETHPLQPVADILVLAGDTGYLGDEGFVKHPFWDWASENFKEVIVIPGNHEFYLGYDLEQLYDGWCMEIRHNIRCYYNAVKHLSDDTDLIVSTLWGYIEPQDAFSTERRVKNFIAYSRIDYWVYGHSHRNIDRIIGNTQCVSNQLGYVNHGESESFDSKKCINLML
jgi:predicted phosphodiesterase